jgi:hypothetical protein
MVLYNIVCEIWKFNVSEDSVLNIKFWMMVSLVPCNPDLSSAAEFGEWNACWCR